MGTFVGGGDFTYPGPANIGEDSPGPASWRFSNLRLGLGDTPDSRPVPITGGGVLGRPTAAAAGWQVVNSDGATLDWPKPESRQQNPHESLVHT